MTEKNKKPANSALKYTGIAAQMGVTIFLGAYLGKYLDEKYPMDKKWFTIGLTLLGVGLSLFNVIRQLNKMNDESN